jgi:hypothetical protein
MKSGDYSEGYFLHGFGVRLAEAAAEYVHRRIRQELGIGNKQGERYSWGYPAIPDHRHHEIVFDLLPAREKLGMQLTEGWSLVPELATAAIVVHHPEAKYFSAVDPDDFRGTNPASGVRPQASEKADRPDGTQREAAVSDAGSLTPEAQAVAGEVEAKQ